MNVTSLLTNHPETFYEPDLARFDLWPKTFEHRNIAYFSLFSFQEPPVEWYCVSCYYTTASHQHTKFEESTPFLVDVITQFRFGLKLLSATVYIYIYTRPDPGPAGRVSGLASSCSSDLWGFCASDVIPMLYDWPALNVSLERVSSFSI